MLMCGHVQCLLCDVLAGGGCAYDVLPWVLSPDAGSEMGDVRWRCTVRNAYRGSSDGCTFHRSVRGQRATGGVHQRVVVGANSMSLRCATRLRYPLENTLRN